MTGKLVFRGETGMRVAVQPDGAVSLWPDQSRIAVTMTAREWGDIVRCAEMLGDDLSDAKEIT